MREIEYTGGMHVKVRSVGTGLAQAPVGQPPYDPNNGFNHWMNFWLCLPGFPCGPSPDEVDGDSSVLPEWFLPGLNKLTFQVRNTGGPTGLRVEMGSTIVFSSKKSPKSKDKH